ncbi:MAG TPA: ATP-binding protein [Ignavibacteria bacterium]
MVKRTLANRISEKLFRGNAILIFGPRQSGKTTLVNSILTSISKKLLYINGDEFSDREALSQPNVNKLKSLIGKNEIVFIDEAQKISEIGNTLKIITDHLKSVQVIAAGSSSFELANKLNEPLTGRKYEFLILPFAFSEMVNYTSLFEEQKNLELRLVYGYYPEIVLKKDESLDLIKILTNSYLFKDIFSLEGVKNHLLLENLVKAIALQIGGEVSINELSRQLGANHNLIEKYLTILEQTYVIYKLSSYCKNVRNEIRKSKKYYFYDNGIRNAIIGNFAPISLRTDKGALWENFIISERIKYNLYNGRDVKYYFWRTKQQQEIDLIEEHNGSLSAFEVKWSKNTNLKIPKTFTNNYSVNKIGLINSGNFFEFLI